jgi:hypothetical protein
LEGLPSHESISNNKLLICTTQTLGPVAAVKSSVTTMAALTYPYGNNYYHGRTVASTSRFTQRTKFDQMVRFSMSDHPDSRHSRVAWLSKSLQSGQRSGHAGCRAEIHARKHTYRSRRCILRYLCIATDTYPLNFKHDISTLPYQYGPSLRTRTVRTVL